jgi:hypothetical protein
VSISRGLYQGVLSSGVDTRSTARDDPHPSANPVATTPVVATSLATQSLASDRTGQHVSDDVPDLSSADAPGHHWLDDFRPTRNRKVEGSESLAARYNSRGQTASDRFACLGQMRGPGSLLAM